MDSFFLDPAGLNDPNEVPLPPQQVRIRELTATPWPDGRRIRVYLEVDPFQKRPSAEVQVLDSEERVAAEVSIIETATRKMEFNLHLRMPETAGDYVIIVDLYYEEGPTISEPASAETAVTQEAVSPARKVVDQRRVRFTIP